MRVLDLYCPHLFPSTEIKGPIKEDGPKVLPLGFPLDTLLTGSFLTCVIWVLVVVFND